MPQATAQSMPILLIKILKVDDVDELKVFGSYLDLKNIIEKNLDLKLGVKGWDSLFQKIKQLRLAVPKNKDRLFEICRSCSLDEAKSKTFELIGTRVAANNKKQLMVKLENLVKCFGDSSFDPCRRFEETKLKNFKNSSKLEGIEIFISSESSSLREILAKYKR